MKLKDMTIGKKITAGFGVVLTLLLVVGALSYLGVNGIVGNAGLVIDGNRLDGVLAQKEVDHLNWVNQVNALLTDDQVTTLSVQTDDHKCGFGQWLYGQGRKDAEALVPSLKPLLKSIEQPHQHLHASAVTIGKLFQPVDRSWGSFLREKKNDHLAWTHKIKDAFITQQQTRLDIQMDPTKCGLGKWLYSEETQAKKTSDAKLEALLTQIDAPHRELHESAHMLEALMMKGEFESAIAQYNQMTAPAADKACGILDQIIDWHDGKMKNMLDANQVYAGQTVPALKSTQELINTIRSEARRNVMTDEVMLSAANRAQRNVSIVALAALVCGIVLAFFLARGIVVVLRRISAEIGDGAGQVSAAASQVAGASQSLAEGASQQAASIEESSSGLEELSSMTQRNADNARQADQLMKSANQVVGEADQSMENLNASMADILKASQETSKIIKTIDEIAFQTNLLALNAAVEAARAGEAGAGFAVVADEVRNLAMRAAEAAKNTATLIEGTVKRVDEGAKLVTRTNDAFKEVSGATAKVGDLVAEISAASEEQATGVGQINDAVTEMDKVTQQNAANSEESASSAEEMSAQALQMAQFASELQAMVNGRNGDTIDTPPPPEPRDRQYRGLKMAAVVKRVGLSQDPPCGSGSVQSANSLIPLDDDEESLRSF